MSFHEKKKEPWVPFVIWKGLGSMLEVYIFAVGNVYRAIITDKIRSKKPNIRSYLVK